MMIALLDATSVIEAHKLGLWGAFSTEWDIAVTPAVRWESQYFRTPLGEKVPIDITISISSGRVSEVDPPAVQVISLIWEMREGYRIVLGSGESQCVAVVRANPTDFACCTFDRAALRCLGILGLDANYVPFAEVFPGINSTPLDARYTGQYCAEWVQHGVRERIH